MRIITLLGQKGGTGKSTTAQLLAVSGALDQRATVIVDLDPQTTCANWYDRRGTDGMVEVVSTQASRLGKVLEAAEQQGVETVLIDTPGKAADISITASKVAGLVLVPLQPSIADLETLWAVRDVLLITGQPPAYAVISRAPTNGSRDREARREIAAFGLAVCPITIHQRVAYQQAQLVGQSPEELEPAGKAAWECGQLYRWTREVLR